MKLGTKVFFFVIMFFSVIFLFSGYTLISFFNETAMEREVEAAIEKYQYNKFVIQSALITRGEEWFEGVAGGEYDVSNMVSDMNDTVAFFSLDGSVLFSEFPEETEFSGLLADVRKDKVTYQFSEINNRTHLLIVGMITQKESGIYLVTGVDVERVLEQQNQMLQKFGVVYAVAIGIGVLLIYFLSTLLTRPMQF